MWLNVKEKKILEFFAKLLADTFNLAKITFSLMPFHMLFQERIHFHSINQLEKLEAAKAACLVYLSLLSLTGSFLALLGLS